MALHNWPFSDLRQKTIANFLAAVMDPFGEE